MASAATVTDKPHTTTTTTTATADPTPRITTSPTPLSSTGPTSFSALTNLSLDPSLFRSATSATLSGGAGRLNPASASGEDRIIVGIDFGTTHSAVAWALTSSPEEYEVITTWPGQAGKDWGKVPSDVSYTVAVGEGGEGEGDGEGGGGTEVGYKWYVFYDRPCIGTYMGTDVGAGASRSPRSPPTVSHGSKSSSTQANPDLNS